MGVADVATVNIGKVGRTTVGELVAEGLLKGGMVCGILSVRELGGVVIGAAVTAPVVREKKTHNKM